MKERPTYKITPDSSIVWIDEPYGLEIFFPHPDDEECDYISCACGKEGEMNYLQQFPIGTNIFDIEKWALTKMDYYNK